MADICNARREREIKKAVMCPIACSRQRIVTLAVIGLLLSSCSHTLKQSEELADAGIKYADTMEQLLEASTDLVIDDDSDTLLYQQRLTSLADKEAECTRLEGFLEGHDEELKQQVKLLSTLREQNRLLRHYFANLQALAATDASASTAKAVERLGAAINRANGVIRKHTAGLAVSSDEQNAIASLAGVAAKGIQARMLKEALERDGPIIDEQLLLQEKLIAILTDMLRHSADKRYVTDRKVVILRPYKNKEIRDVNEWKRVRKELLRSSFHSDVLDTAVQSARQMRLVWRNIVENKTNLASINLLIGDLDQLLTTAELIRQARKGE